MIVQEAELIMVEMPTNQDEREKKRGEIERKNMTVVKVKDNKGCGDDDMTLSNFCANKILPFCYFSAGYS